MRITGGYLGGRRLMVPRAGVRPTADRVREAVFSALGEDVRGARVLDLFAGTGAWGLEAWSRDASAVTWVERDRRVFRVLRGNVERLCGAEAGRCCVCADVDRYLSKRPGAAGPFHLVFADPPYDRSGREAGRVEKLLRALGTGRILHPDGRLVMEQWGEEPVTEPGGWRIAWRREYGEARVQMYVARPPAGKENLA